MQEQVIAIDHEQDVITARKAGRAMAQTLGFGLADQTRLATAISELARNVIEYATNGTCKITGDSSSERTWVEAVISDHGPGIPDIEKALQDGYSTGNSLGAGLCGAKRLVHVFEIKSIPGHTEIKILLEKNLNGHE
jgi:serine/threonine-protein kinase RsbT